jgi:uncharacterized protein (UPF0332 family)
VTQDGKRAAVQEELALSDEDLVGARLMIGSGLFRLAMTRIYYAAFHAERALVFSAGGEPRSHEGVHHLLNLLFIAKGRVEPKWSRVMAILQKYREAADYGGPVVFDRRSADDSLADAEAFCALVRELLRTDGYLS